MKTLDLEEVLENKDLRKEIIEKIRVQCIQDIFCYQDKKDKENTP